MLPSKLIEFKVCSKADLFLISEANLPLQMSILSPKRPKRSWKSGKSSRHRMFASTSVCVCYFVRLCQSPFFVFRGFMRSGTALLMLKRAQKMKSKKLQKKKGVFIGNIFIIWMCYFQDLQKSKAREDRCNQKFPWFSWPSRAEAPLSTNIFPKRKIFPLISAVLFFFILVFVPSTALQQHWTFPPCVC